MKTKILFILLLLGTIFVAQSSIPVVSGSSSSSNKTQTLCSSLLADFDKSRGFKINAHRGGCKCSRTGEFHREEGGCGWCKGYEDVYAKTHDKFGNPIGEWDDENNELILY